MTPADIAVTAALALYVSLAAAMTLTLPRIIRKYRIPVRGPGHVLVFAALIAAWPGAVLVGIAAYVTRRSR